ncbi:hypothetical protein ACCS48_34505, partial [Rhizobium brockwellii]|uniref:hypothetical protein n=1 Tax=Rhizobium brockwellii TaxID=3019932 RepID=UPI003F9E47EA
MSTDALSYGLVELTRVEASKISGGFMLVPLAVLGVLAGGVALAHVAGDIGQFEELAPRMAPAER